MYLFRQLMPNSFFFLFQLKLFPFLNKIIDLGDDIIQGLNNFWTLTRQKAFELPGLKLELVQTTYF